MALDDRGKIGLGERDLPTHWYDIVPDLPNPPSPPLHPGTGQPLGPADLAPLFPTQSAASVKRSMVGHAAIPSAV